MSKQILKSYIEVGNRLDDLGTSRNFIDEIVDAVVAARSECTENDPSGAPGWRGWQMGTRRSRELHLGVDAWEKDDTDQIASIINKRTGIRIVVCNTDDGTCVENEIPKPRSKKGSATERVIEQTQLSFVDRLDKPHPSSVVQFPKKKPKSGPLTYYLCVFHDGDDIRAELSCFVETSGGYFSRWEERIFILGGQAGSPEPAKRRESDDNDGSDFDIPVKRKK